MMEQMLRVGINHSYYSNNRCGDLDIRPSSATAAMLRKWGIVGKMVNGSFVLLCETMENEKRNVPAYFPGEGFRMVFLLYSSNPYFLNFTDLPLTAQESVLYFSNHYDNVQGDTLLLHKESTVTGSDLVMLRPLAFNVLLDITKQNNVKVMDHTGEIVLNDTVSAGVKEYYVNIPTEGLYTIETGDSDPVQFYALGRERGTVIGVIELFVDDKVPVTHRMLADDNTVRTRSYSMQFSNRATTWTYYIKDSNADENSGLWLGSTRAGVSFTGPKKVALLNGDNAIAFYSEEPVRLEERPKTFFQLRKDSKDGKVLVDQLPAPGTSLIRPSGEGNFQSEIYINL